MKHREWRDVWEKDFDLASFEESINPKYVGYTAPLTDAQRFGLHERIRDELLKLPYYTISHGNATQLHKDLVTNEIHDLV